VDQGAYTAGVLAAIPIAELSRTLTEDFLYMELQGVCGGEKIRFTNECFFAKYKEYQLPQSEIQHRLYEDAQGQIHLEIASKVPAFYVFAEFRGVSAVFSDNSFTLLPGQPRDLTITVGGKFPVKELENRLVIRNLRSSYEE